MKIQDRKKIKYRCPCCGRRLFDSQTKVRKITIKCPKCKKVVDIYG